MKANAPEKIYLPNNPVLSISNLNERTSEDDIEYTRTDAFIEKACTWLRTHSEEDYFELIQDYNYCGAGNLNKKRMIEDFKNCMKGE